ncbi:hypothetical protein DL96DRAFT_1666751 [Flagelloscypha sp. PMI_526]|nr:hypothetical protein DL96DRAFT_1666751 [Flagelloscypha sp. PMI_526]
MFGCVVAGRPVQTNLQQIDTTHAVFELTDANRINHLCVFLLGTVPFPDNMACTVHLYYPGKGFQLLGGQAYFFSVLSNEKPSAIFRLKGAYTPSSGSSSHTHTVLSSLSSQWQQPSDSVTATLGFALEPVDDVERQLSSLAQSSKPTLDMSKDPVILAERVAQNLFNYLAGFGGGMISQDTAVPMSVVSRWFENFKTKLQARGIGFLDPQD